MILINLFFTLQVATHLTIPCLSNHLCLLNVTITSDLSTLLHTVPHNHVCISLLLYLFSLIANLLMVCNDTHAFISVQSSVRYLSLEWELLDQSHIDVVVLNKFLYRLHSVFKSKN